MERLALDHQHAKALESALASLDYVDSVIPVQTNIVIFKVNERFGAIDIVRKLRDEGILCNTTNRDTIRFVTHLDISADMIDRAIDILKNLNP